MNKLTLEPGRKYRGSGWVNEYGEIHFRPEQKGSKPQNMHLVYEESDLSISESANFFKIMVKIEKKSFSTMSVANKFMFLLTKIKTYLK